MMFPQLLLLQVTTKHIKDFTAQVDQHSVLRLTLKAAMLHFTTAEEHSQELCKRQVLVLECSFQNLRGKNHQTE